MLYAYRGRILILTFVFFGTALISKRDFDSQTEAFEFALALIVWMFPMLWTLGWWMDNERLGNAPPQWIIRNARTLCWCCILASIVAGVVYLCSAISYPEREFISWVVIQFALIPSLLLARFTTAHSSLK
jgi:hypothetical protein